jgi:hypothetical protein
MSTNHKKTSQPKEPTAVGVSEPTDPSEPRWITKLLAAASGSEWGQWSETIPATELPGLLEWMEKRIQSPEIPFEEISRDLRVHHYLREEYNKRAPVSADAEVQSD